MSAVILFESKRAETAPVQRKVSVEDLVCLQDRHPPSGIVPTKCLCGRCDRTVEYWLEDIFALDFQVFEQAIRSGRSRREALFLLRDAILKTAEVRDLLSDSAISRRSIIAGVHKRTASVAWRITFEQRPKRPQCGVSKTLDSVDSGTQAPCYA
jgi:hypothetical protein